MNHVLLLASQIVRKVVRSVKEDVQSLRRNQQSRLPDDVTINHQQRKQVKSQVVKLTTILVFLLLDHPVYVLYKLSVFTKLIQ